MKQTIVITGASNGLGKVLSVDLAKKVVFSQKSEWHSD